MSFPVKISQDAFLGNKHVCMHTRQMYYIRHNSNFIPEPIQLTSITRIYRVKTFSIASLKTYALFLNIYIYICVCVCACVWMNYYSTKCGTRHYPQQSGCCCLNPFFASATPWRVSASRRRCWCRFSGSMFSVNAVCCNFWRWNTKSCTFIF